MSSHEATLPGYTLIVSTGFGPGILAHRSTAIPTLGEVTDWVLQTRSGRIALFATWAWLGLHLVA